MPTGTRPAPPAGVARVAVQGVWLTHRWVSVFWLDLTGTPTVDDLKDIADKIATEYNTEWAPHITSDWSLQSVTVVWIGPGETELAYTGSYAYGGTRTGATSLQDAAACAVLDFVISDYYRGGHPRQYLAGVCVDEVTNGSNFSSTAQSTRVTALNAIRNALNAFTTTNVSAMVMGTVRFAEHNAWLSPPVFRAFTSVKFGKLGKLGSQRRRIMS